MAHVAKYDRASVARMLGHYDRSKPSLAEHVNPDKSNQNYNLAMTGYRRMDPREDIERLRDRCTEVHCQNRKDVKVLCDWVVTLPESFSQCYPDRQKEFFSRTYEFLRDRYGEKNVVSAYVHMDEATPHMHFAFVPVVPDRRRGGEKVSAKECLTRAELQSFHGDLENYLAKTLQVPLQELGILNDATREGNRSINELKRKSAAERLQETQRDCENRVIEATERVRLRNTHLEELNAEYEAKKGLLGRFEAPVATTSPPKVKRFLGLGAPKVELDQEEYDRLVAQAARVVEIDRYLRQAEEAWENVRSGSDYRTNMEWQLTARKRVQQYLAPLENKVKLLETENNRLEKKIDTLQQEYDRFADKAEAVLQCLPERAVRQAIEIVERQQERDRGRDHGGPSL